MDSKTIKSMICNSTWVSKKKKSTYKFVDGNKLSFNGEDHLNYSINSRNKKTELRIGADEKYSIEYVNDFNLKLSNINESFSIMPE